MNARFTFFALVIGVCAFGFGLAIPLHPTQCGPNAEFRECGSACEPDCSHPEPYPMCTMQCVSGCFCKPGFLKNTRGECVLPEKCNEQAHPRIPVIKPDAMFALPPEMQCNDANAVFDACGSACAPTCANPNPSPACTRQCVIGCFCKPGYLKNDQGVCVPANKCNEHHMRPRVGPPVTGGHALFAYPPDMQCNDLNEVFLTCGSACAPTCADPTPSPVCTRQCVVGCFCKPGYLRNENGVCVPAEQCVQPAEVEQVCGENEEFYECKPCEKSCDNMNPVCPRICRTGCGCKAGHVRGANGRCMKFEMCDKTS